MSQRWVNYRLWAIAATGAAVLALGGSTGLSPKPQKTFFRGTLPPDLLASADVEGRGNAGNGRLPFPDVVPQLVPTFEFIVNGATVEGGTADQDDTAEGGAIILDSGDVFQVRVSVHVDGETARKIARVNGVSLGGPREGAFLKYQSSVVLCRPNSEGDVDAGDILRLRVADDEASRQAYMDSLSEDRSPDGELHQSYEAVYQVPDAVGSWILVLNLVGGPAGPAGTVPSPQVIAYRDVRIVPPGRR